MAIQVQIPHALRSACDGQKELSISAATVRAALRELEQVHHAVFQSICDETGAVRRHIHLFVNSSFLPIPHGLDTPLETGDVLYIMTAVSGG